MVKRKCRGLVVNYTFILKALFTIILSGESYGRSLREKRGGGVLVCYFLLIRLAGQHDLDLYAFASSEDLKLLLKEHFYLMLSTDLDSALSNLAIYCKLIKSRSVYSSLTDTYSFL